MPCFYSINLTSAEIQRILINLSKKVNLKSEECHTWTGQRNQKGYGIFELRVRGQKFKVLVHRLIFYLKNNCVQMPTNKHVSHICHNKLCVNTAHLSFEPARVNNKRQICKNEGYCTGHFGYLHCILN